MHEKESSAADKKALIKATCRKAAIKHDVKEEIDGQVLTGTVKDFDNFNPPSVTITNTNGQALATLNNFKGVLYLATDNNGNTLCYATITFSITSDGWYTSTSIVNPGPGGLITVQNMEDASGGLLQSVSPPLASVVCGQTTAFQNQASVNPNIFDPCEIMALSFPGGHWYFHC